VSGADGIERPTRSVDHCQAALRHDEEPVGLEPMLDQDLAGL